jgi:hypothetical protein
MMRNLRRTRGQVSLDDFSDICYQIFDRLIVFFLRFGFRYLESRDLCVNWSVDIWIVTSHRSSPFKSTRIKRCKRGESSSPTVRSHLGQPDVSPPFNDDVRKKPPFPIQRKKTGVAVLRSEKQFGLERA